MEQKTNLPKRKYLCLEIYFLGKQSTEKTPITYFGEPKDGTYNYDFYNYFKKKLDSARKSIYITGDGFECADEEGKQLAQDFNGTIKRALQRNVSVVRVVTRSKVHTEWASMLGQLMEEFPSLCELFVIQEGKGSQMSSICVIDPEDGSGSVVEIMLSSQKLFGSNAADLASTAIFIEGKQNLAKDLRNRILYLTKPDMSIHVKDKESAISSLTSKEYYFAYGSNMSSDQMTQRINQAEFVCIGFLSNHKIVLRCKGSYREGGVASVEAESSERVYGIVWKISLLKLAELDEIEDLNVYSRSVKTILSEYGIKYQCHVYKAISQGSLKPDQEYLELVIKAAKDMRLPIGHSQVESFSR